MIWIFYMIVNWIYLLTLNQLPMKKLLLMMSGKKPCIRSMMLSSRMGHGIWLTLHSKPNQLAASGSSITSTNMMTHLTSTKWGLWKNDLHKNKSLIMRRLLPPQQNGIPFILCFPGQHKMDGKFIIFGISFWSTISPSWRSSNHFIKTWSSFGCCDCGDWKVEPWWEFITITIIWTT